MHHCKELLQEPFIFVSCDTIFKGMIPKFDHNWMAYSERQDISQYRSLIVDNANVEKILEKDSKGDDLKPYIGLAGIFDYEVFWKEMDTSYKEAIKVGETVGLRNLIKRGIKLLL